MNANPPTSPAPTFELWSIPRGAIEHVRVYEEAGRTWARVDFHSGYGLLLEAGAVRLMTTALEAHEQRERGR